MAAPAPQTVALALGGPMTRAELPAFGERLAAILDSRHAEVVLCDLAGATPDAVTVDALARVHLAAKRHGCETRVRGASRELIALLDVVGLSGLAPV